MCHIDFKNPKISNITRDMAIKGQIVVLYAMVKEKLVLTQKNDINRKYFDINLMDSTGVMNLKIWEYDESLDQTILPGCVVQVIAKVSLYQNKLYLTAVYEDFKNKVRVAKDTEYDINYFIEQSPKVNSDETKMQIRDIINGLTLQHIRALLIKLILSNERYFIDYAGKRYHHTYGGGLARHSLETALYALGYAKMNNLGDYEQELVQAIALLHDIGKLEEYDKPPLVEITVKGRLFGHSYLGAAMVEKAIDEISGFPEKDKLIIVHSILSHHGKLEDGAVVAPSTIEAVIVHQADKSSAEIEGVLDYIEKDSSDTEITDYNNFRKQFFIKLKSDPPIELPNVS